MPLLSIIIPTHNRQNYAAIAASKILQECRETEVIISDTSDEDTLPQLLAEIPASERLTYIRQGRAMDVVSHFEAALEYATGKFIMFLGDDDCVGPEIENIVRWADQNGVDAVTSYRERFLANYFWPGVHSKYYGDRYAAALFVHPFSARAWPIQPHDAIRAAIRNFGRGLGAMPRIYHGIVARSLVDRIRQKYRALFGGVSPDIHSAILISSEAANAWCVDFPFCLPGGSASSTAGSGAARSDTPKLREHPHIRPFRNLEWDALIPEFYAPYTVWAFSAKRALDCLDDPKLRPNYPRLYACCLLYGRGYGDAPKRAVEEHARRYGRLRTYLAIAREMIGEGAFQVRRIALRIVKPAAGGGAQRIGELRTISEAYDALYALCRSGDASLTLPGDEAHKPN